MTESIPSLIARLDAWNGRADHEGCVHHVPIELLTDVRAELSRLTASPLPVEIAEIVDDLRSPPAMQYVISGKAASALQQQAREIGRLKRLTVLAPLSERDKTLVEKLETAGHRVAELEAERDAIRARTIEECATVKAVIPQGLFATATDACLIGFQAGVEAMVKAIRALNQGEAGGGEQQ